MKCTICNKESDKQDILHMATKEFINLLQNKFERRKENVHGN